MKFDMYDVNIVSQQEVRGYNNTNIEEYWEIVFA